jgi:hypothetical protein
MSLKIFSPKLFVSSLILLVSCTPALESPTLTPIPPTLTPLPSPTLTPLPPTRTPLPPPISADFPTGIFFHQHTGGPYCVFQFNEDGAFAYYWMIPSLDLSGRKPHETGTYRISNNLYTVTSTDLTWCPAPATYTWTYDGQTLTFQVFGEDACTDRQKTYESPLFYKKLK